MGKTINNLIIVTNSLSILDPCWVQLLHGTKCPEFCRNGQKWHLLRECKQTKYPFSENMSLKNAPMHQMTGILSEM